MALSGRCVSTYRKRGHDVRRYRQPRAADPMPQEISGHQPYAPAQPPSSLCVPFGIMACMRMVCHILLDIMCILCSGYASGNLRPPTLRAARTIPPVRAASLCASWVAMTPWHNGMVSHILLVICVLMLCGLVQTPTAVCLFDRQATIKPTPFPKSLFDFMCVDRQTTG